MDDFEQLAKDHGIYWAARERQRFGAVDETWPGGMDEARVLVDWIARSKVHGSRREQLAEIILGRARWAWSQFRKAAGATCEGDSGNAEGPPRGGASRDRLSSPGPTM